MQRAIRVRQISEELRDLRGPLLPILHALMNEFGWIDVETDLPVVADVLNLSQAEVYGVVSFYHDFLTAPPKQHQVRICRGEACQSVGSAELWERRTDWESDVVATSEVFCLGNCALGPAGTLDGQLRGRLDAATIKAQVSQWQA